MKRYDVDAKGNLQNEKVTRHRNPDRYDVVQFDSSVDQTLEELHENGEDAVNLDPDSFAYALEDYEFVFVNFFASWYAQHTSLFFLFSS